MLRYLKNYYLWAKDDDVLGPLVAVTRVCLPLMAFVTVVAAIASLLGG